METNDAQLLHAAAGLMDEHYVMGRQEVVAAARLADGTIVTGIHVEASQGRASVCAESGIASAAVIAGSAVVAIVAIVQRPGGTRHIIEPCGVCAELLADYWPSARVWVGRGSEPAAVAVTDLLPFRHTRTGRLNTSSKENLV
ncbi:cytidine deaminase [Demequina sediminicola]|uniref:cytidine deaminase n=1 Tax=Demequina sediminicola TaxID=1095026 RepID=UPI00078221C1|nr:cytidine deaminase [Demequina sediminicola]